MKKITLSSRSKRSGQGLVVLIILLAVIGAGLWYLYSAKATADREAREFARDAIKRLTVDHDRQYLETHLGPQAKLDLPPSGRDYMIQKFAQFGVPAQPMQIDESVTFESYFFEPRGYFTAHLNYPGQGATLQLATSHPVSRWQIDNVTFTPQASMR
jgi:type II secretory pathway pseudopilin PulG